MLSVLLTNAEIAQISISCSREDLLDLAMGRVDVPRVKAPLEADAGVHITWKIAPRLVKYTMESSSTDLGRRNQEIATLLLAEEHVEIFGPSPYLRTRLLITAVKQQSLAMVSWLIDGVHEKLGQDGAISVLINGQDLYSRTALSYICDASTWPHDKEGRDHVLAITKLLLLHRADTNKDGLYDPEIAPLYRCCSIPRAFILRGHRLDALHMQCEMIHLLLQSGAYADIRRADPLSDYLGEEIDWE